MQCRSKTKTKGNFYIEFQTSRPGLSSAYQNVQTKIIQKTLLITENAQNTHTHTLSLSLSLTHTHTHEKESSKSRMNELQGVAEFDEKEQFEKRKKLTDSKR